MCRITVEDEIWKLCEQYNSEDYSDKDDFASTCLKEHGITPTTERISAFNLGFRLGKEQAKKPSSHMKNVTKGRNIKTYNSTVGTKALPPKIIRVRELRKYFWEDHPDWKKKYYKYNKRQNQYPTDIRCAWTDFVDWTLKAQLISERLANNAIL